MLHENSPAHHYRPGYNPEFVRRVKRKREREAQAAAKAAEVERKLAQETMIAHQKAALAEARKADQAFKATEAYRIIIVSEVGEGRQSARAIIERVASVFGVPYGEIVGARRNKHVIAARHAAIRAVVEARPDMTLPMVGRVFNKDHTTIMHALGRKKRKPAGEA